MPYARVNEIDLYYEVHGEGPNLALIEGTGYDLWMWYRQLPEFSRRFRTLVYDNRGMGRSDKPPGPYTHAMNAADLAGLLDHLGWDRTHVLGISMGGFIAQEFALAYPHRLDRLILIATAFGGPNMVPVPMEAIRAMTPNPALAPDERIRQAMPIAFARPDWPERNADEFEWIVQQRLQYPPTPESALAQLLAAVPFNVESRLGEIAAPTLVVAGSEDHVVPPRNAELLAERIPNACLDIIPGVGHLSFIEDPNRLNADVIGFLSHDL